MNKNNIFETDYAKVEYIEEDNIVFLTWKNYCCLDNYRAPATFALNLLQKFSDSNFIVDARNGFEDTQEDIDWGFSYLIPEMTKTTCKFIMFIMNEANDIEEEIDLWTKEFGKHFTVLHAESYPEAIAAAKSAYMIKVSYEIKKAKRAQFISEILEAGILSSSREEPQNIYYDMYIPVDSDSSIHLVELWPSEKAIDIHKRSKHYEILTALKAKYDIKAEILKSHIDI